MFCGDSDFRKEIQVIFPPPRRGRTKERVDLNLSWMNNPLTPTTSLRNFGDPHPIPASGAREEGIDDLTVRSSNDELVFSGLFAVLYRYYSIY